MKLLINKALKFKVLSVILQNNYKPLNLQL